MKNAYTLNQTYCPNALQIGHPKLFRHQQCQSFDNLASCNTMGTISRKTCLSEPHSSAVWPGLHGPSDSEWKAALGMLLGITAGHRVSYSGKPILYRRTQDWKLYLYHLLRKGSIISELFLLPVHPFFMSSISLLFQFLSQNADRLFVSRTITGIGMQQHRWSRAELKPKAEWLLQSALRTLYWDCILTPWMLKNKQGCTA